MVHIASLGFKLSLVHISIMGFNSFLVHIFGMGFNMGMVHISYWVSTYFGFTFELWASRAQWFTFF